MAGTRAALWLFAGVLWTLAATISLRSGAKAEAEPPPPPASDRFDLRGSAPWDFALELRQRFSPPDIPYWPFRPGDFERPPSPPATLRHRVEPGETLTSIVRGYLGPAARYEPTAEANGLTEPYRVIPGQEIVIAGAPLHRTNARATMLVPVESRAERERRQVLGLPANPPPGSAFTPLEPRLVVVRGWRMAFAWWVPAAAAAIYLCAAGLAAFRALGRGRAGLRPADLGRCASAGGGAYALAGAAAVFLRMGGLTTGLAAAAAAGVGAYFLAKDRSDATKRYLLDVFAFLAVCALALWLTGSLERAANAIALP